MTRDQQDEFYIEPLWPKHVDELAGHKKGELLALKGSYSTRIITFIRRNWPGLAQWHDTHDNWNECFLKCKLSFEEKCQIFEIYFSIFPLQCVKWKKYFYLERVRWTWENFHHYRIQIVKLAPFSFAKYQLAIQFIQLVSCTLHEILHVSKLMNSTWNEYFKCFAEFLESFEMVCLMWTKLNSVRPLRIS